MTSQRETLQGYVNDMLAVEREIHSAFSRQKHDDRLKEFPAASQLVARIEDTIDRHLSALSAGLTRIGGDESTIKKAVGTVMGVAAGLYDKVRSDDTVSRMLRDDYASLSFATVCYEMLQTTALAMKDEQTADLALRHLEDFAPMIMDLSDTLPRVLVDELSREGKVAPDVQAADEARRRTREAWKHSSAAQQV